jgi:hypothetical protein
MALHKQGMAFSAGLAYGTLRREKYPELNVGGDSAAMAAAVGAHRKALGEGLKRAVSDISCPLMRALFRRGAHYDFAAKRLYASDREIYLQWQMRWDDDAPASYENQQTNVGKIVAYWTDDAAERLYGAQA